MDAGKRWLGSVVLQCWCEAGVRLLLKPGPPPMTAAQCVLQGDRQRVEPEKLLLCEYGEVYNSPNCAMAHCVAGATTTFDLVLRCDQGHCLDGAATTSKPVFCCNPEHCLTGAAMAFDSIFRRDQAVASKFSEILRLDRGLCKRH